MPNFIVGLDLGSRSIKAVVGEVRRGELFIRHAFKMPSAGFRRGVIDDMGEATQAISPVVAELRKISKQTINNIYLAVGGSDIRVQPSVGVVAVSRADYEICQDDVNRAIQSAQSINLPNNRIILHVIVREFVVDGVKDIRDPLEMVGNRLEVNTLIIDAFAPSVKNLSRCVEVLGGNVKGLVLGLLADARAVLSKNQKELGVAVIDIGFGKTGLCVFEENKLLHAAVFPGGSREVTNDLAIVLKIPVEAAETIKLSYGAAMSHEVGTRETIDLSKIDAHARGTVSRRRIAEVIEWRLAEIFALVQNELKYLGKAGKLPAGVVLVGGGAKLPGVAELAKQHLKLPVQIGAVEFSPAAVADSDLAHKLEDPEFVSASGLLFEGYDRQVVAKPLTRSFGKAFGKFFRYFAP